MSVIPTMQALRILLIIVEMLLLWKSVFLFKQITFQTSLSQLFFFFFSRAPFLCSWKKKKLFIYSPVPACAQPNPMLTGCLQPNLLHPLNKQEVKEQDNFAYLSLVAELQQLVVRQHHLSSCADIFQLHILKLKF